jgi:predicted ATPase/class 3 adenylate cyclase
MTHSIAMSHDGLVPASLPIGTVTFLFTDIEGSTRLLQALGKGYRDVLERQAAIVRQALAEHEGVEVSTEGDAFFAVFRSVTGAVAAAVTAQRALAEEQWPGGHRVRVRMGLHTGEGLLGGDSYVGIDVHRAARIADAGHGGQVLLSATSRALVETTLPEGVTLRDLGTHRLKDLDQSEHLAQLIIIGLDQEFPAIRSLETPSNLPEELTTFVGRESEVDEARRILATTRLLTLTGPGGTGKTRLAIRVAAGLGSTFGDGVFFVDLAPLTDPGLVGATTARTLGLSEQAQRPIIELLKEHLESREILLVLDNFEHILAAGEIVQELLTAAPRLKALVTSRSILNLYGEQEFAVPPLALPDPRSHADLALLSQYEAVALFIERARAAKPAFSITRETAPAVAEICVRLDGLPLAIELAASRIRMLEPAEILVRLQQHLPVLATGGSNVPARQRTLRGAIEWSHQLLNTAEQALFARLTIFAGGCTIEAADAVCNPSGELGLETIDGIAALVDQSLLRQAADGGESRFAMLETIREYGRDRLAASGDIDAIGQRHLRHFKDLALVGERHFVGLDQAAWLDRFEREHDNVRAALRGAVNERHVDDGLQLAAALWRFWYQRGYLREGRAWLKELIGLQPDTASAARAKAHEALGGLAYWLSDVVTAQGSYESAVGLYRELGDREGEAGALYNLAFVPVMRRDLDAAVGVFKESLALAREVDRADLVAKNEHALGVALRQAGDVKAGLPLLERAVAFFREGDDRHQLVWGLGEVAVAYHMLGQRQEAWAAFRETLSLVTEAGNLPGIAASLELISMLESSEGRHAEAARMAAAAAALRDETGVTGELMSSLAVDVTQVARAALGEEAVEQAVADGRAMTFDEAIEYARTLATARQNTQPTLNARPHWVNPLSKCPVSAWSRIALGDVL